MAPETVDALADERSFAVVDDAGAASTPAALVAPRDYVIDKDAVWRALVDADDVDASVADRRLAAASILRAALAAGRGRIEAAFDEGARSGLKTAWSFAAMIDDVVEIAHRLMTTRFFRVPAHTRGERLAVVAVGGYGRGEMAPHSDVDLLFLTPYRQTDWTESVVEATLYLLWDLKLKVGHATRSVSDCVRLARGDMTIRTSLLEKRFLCGDRDVYETLDARLWSDLFQHTGPEFLEAKLLERDKRHERTGGSRYLLEPNVKESKGGLRDLQTLYWIAKYIYRADSVEALVEQGVFRPEEAARFRAAEAHLWTVRCALHFVAGRAQDKLSFDHQIELAERLRYRSTPGQRAVERFMKRYFAAAKQVGDLTRIFCSALEAQHRKKPPLLGGVARFLSTGDAGAAIPGAEDWLERRDGRLTTSRPAALTEDPVKILQLFETAVRCDILVHPDALRLVARVRRAVDDLLETDPSAGPLFVDILTNSRDPVRALRRLSETGVLGRLLPEFGRIEGLMQFNMYHHYTVDEHTIQAIGVLKGIASGALAEEHRTATHVLGTIDDHRVLTLALFFHDIGKGLPEDHSIAGEAIVRDVGPLLRLSPGEIEQVAWLVRHHLAMSDVAQKRDIADPSTVRDFARLVRSPKRLKLLYALTVCDIRAVGPGVWNAWKAQLLRQLYFATRAALTGDEDGQTRTARIESAQAALARRLRDAPAGDGAPWTDAAIAAHCERFYPTYWLGLEEDTHVLHASMLNAPAPAPISMSVRQAPDRAATEVVFATADHPGLFARMAGAFALAGASVVDARAYTSRDGMAINTFWVQDAAGEPYDDPERLERLERQVDRTLKGEVIPREALRERRKLRRRERSFDVAPQVAIDNASSDTFTLIEVDGRDRVGLLYDLARALSSENVNIFSAIIATYGEQAVDVFYVRDVFGLKIQSATKRRRIEAALLKALESDDLAAR